MAEGNINSDNISDIGTSDQVDQGARTAVLVCRLNTAAQSVRQAEAAGLVFCKHWLVICELAEVQLGCSRCKKLLQ